jgi:hypothetical protein
MPGKAPTAAARTRAATRATAAKKESDQRQLQLAVADPEAKSEGALAVETVDDGKLRVEFKGEKFALKTDVGIMAMMEWAASGDGEKNVGDATTSYLRSIFHVLESLVEDDDWGPFRAHARNTNATLRELIVFQDAAYEAIAATPTKAQES